MPAATSWILVPVAELVIVIVPPRTARICQWHAGGTPGSAGAGPQLLVHGHAAFDAVAPGDRLKPALHTRIVVQRVAERVNPRPAPAPVANVGDRVLGAGQPLGFRQPGFEYAEQSLRFVFVAADRVVELLRR